MPPAIDHTGKRLAQAVVIGLAASTSSKHRNRLWLCRCDCGNEFTCQTQAISSGTTRWCRSCSVHRRGHFTDRTGEKHGTWTVISRAGTDRNKSPTWLLRCRCGKEKTRSNGAMNKMVGRCRCSLFIRNEHPLYPTWCAMRRRCASKSDPKYPHYGGRGIRVCLRWLGRDGFTNFLSDMGERPLGMSLDRVDVHGNYEPSNCRWATAQEQMDNQRLSIIRVRAVLAEAEQRAADGRVSALDLVHELQRGLLGDAA